MPFSKILKTKFFSSRRNLIILGTIILILLIIAGLYFFIKEIRIITQVEKPPYEKTELGKELAKPGVSASEAKPATPKKEVFLAPEKPTPKKSLSSKAKNLWEKTAEKKPLRKDKYGNRSFAEQDNFQINYIAADDRFVIHIWDTENPEKTKKEAENHFLKNVLGTDDKDAACELDVIVAIHGTSILPSKLSFCPEKISSDILKFNASQNNSLISSLFSPLVLSVNAQSIDPQCLAYQNPTVLVDGGKWCSDGFLRLYFGNITESAQKIVSKETGGTCDPMARNPYNPWIGLFQVNMDAGHCSKLGLAYGAECEEQLKDPYVNAWVARQIFDGPGVWCYSQSNCNPWGTGCSCLVCGNIGSPGIPLPASPQLPPPPPAPPGDIIVSQNYTHGAGWTPRTLTPPKVWLSGGSQTQANPAVFSGLSPGVYKVNVNFGDIGGVVLLNYTLCDSNQGGCTRTQWTGCNPMVPDTPCPPLNTYHQWDKLRDPSIISAWTMAVDVNVSAGGYVDLMFHYCVDCMVAKNDNSQMFVKDVFDLQPAFIKEVHAVDSRSPLPPPQPSEPPVINLPSCSNATYGGSSYNDSINVKTRFTAYNATKVEYEAYHNGVRFYNSLQDSGAWQGLNTHTAYDLSVNTWNLSPDVVYSWRVRSGNETQWSPWIWGYPWKVSPCTPPGPPPDPSNLRLENVPSCSDVPYEGVRTVLDTRNTKKIEAKLYKNGTLVWNNVGNGWNTELWHTWFKITWKGLAPGYTYSWEVRAWNDYGWSNWSKSGSYNANWDVWWCSLPDLKTGITPQGGGRWAPDGYWIKPGTTVEFKAAVNNSSSADGGVKADKFQVKWYVNNNPYTGYVNGVYTDWYPGRIFPHMYEWGRASFSFTFPSILERVYTVKFCVDTTNIVPEENNNNNCSEVKVRVTNSSAPADLMVYNGNLELYNSKGEKTRNFKAGETITAKMKIGNTGASDASNFWIGLWRNAVGSGVNNVSNYCNYPNPSASVLFTQIVPKSANETLTPDQTINHTMTFTAPSTAGSYWAYALLDYKCQILENLENNNWALSTYYYVQGLDPKDDPDKDGYTNEQELYMGTDPFKFCSNDSLSNNESVDAWPPDFDDNRVVNITDVSQISGAPYFGSCGGSSNYSRRKDFNMDGCINILDVGNVLPPVFGRSCTPSADADKDGFTNEQELFMGTNPYKSCSSTSTPNDENYDAWPRDLNDDQVVNGLDVSELRSVFGKKQGDPAYKKRYDFNMDGVINILDIGGLMASYFECNCRDAGWNSSCSYSRNKESAASHEGF